jgi:hypothetical protein
LYQKGREALFLFLDKIEIATRKWLIVAESIGGNSYSVPSIVKSPLYDTVYLAKRIIILSVLLYYILVYKMYLNLKLGNNIIY